MLFRSMLDSSKQRLRSRRRQPFEAGAISFSPLPLLAINGGRVSNCIAQLHETFHGAFWNPAGRVRRDVEKQVRAAPDGGLPEVVESPHASRFIAFHPEPVLLKGVANLERDVVGFAVHRHVGVVLGRWLVALTDRQVGGPRAFRHRSARVIPVALVHKYKAVRVEALDQLVERISLLGRQLARDVYPLFEDAGISRMKLG